MDKYFDLRTWITVPIRETLKEIDSNTWLIGPFIIYRSNNPSNTATWIDDNSSYTIAKAPNPPPAAALLSPNNPYVTKVYDAGDASAVWSIGTKVFCKVHILYSEERTTPEDITLKWVRDKLPNNFQVPEVLESATHDYRTILFLTRLPGRTLASVWPKLTTEWRQYYMKAVADICQTMAQWEGDKISGVDGQNIPEDYMTELDSTKHPIDYSPEALEKSCKTSLGMDCSSFVFYHADLNPTNIIVNDQCVGIIDWEIAGYVPRGWIRTKFRISAAMVLENLPGASIAEMWEYGIGVWKMLETKGFETYHENFITWKYNKSI